MKIVIVGGGTSGWLAALYFSKFNVTAENKNEIVVIESSKIPTIGAGEGSTGIFADTVDFKLKSLGVNELDFLYETESTLKLGIRFKDWGGVGNEFLSPLQSSATRMSSVDIDLLSSLVYGNYYDCAESGYLMANEYSSYLNNKMDHLGIHSYHFDAHKVGQYFKKIALEKGVICIDTEVTNVNKNSVTGELSSVDTTIGKIEGDFWIDCTGFARALIGPMEGGWISYKDYLPVNSAIPYIHQYEPNENILAETLAWAQQNGWMWQIPTQNRYGCGYVYSDMFTTSDKALEELQQTTGRKIEPLRNLKFECGRVEKFWVKNVVTLGLASCFLEPLQATSIHTTVVQLDYLLNNNLNFRYDINDVSYQSNINYYNDKISMLCDDFRDLIRVHYVNDREDTPFWKFCKYELKKTPQVESILEICKHRSPSTLDFNMYHGMANWGVWSYTLIGMGHLTKEVAIKSIIASDNESYAKQRVKDLAHRNKVTAIRALKNNDFIKILKDKKLVKHDGNSKYFRR